MYIALNIEKNLKFVMAGIVLVPSKPVAFFDETTAMPNVIAHVEQAIQDGKIFKIDEPQCGVLELKGSKMTAPEFTDEKVVGTIQHKFDEDGQRVTILTFPEE